MARAAQIDGSQIVRAGRATDEAQLRGIPIDLAPLLAPHKKRGRVSLRIERLPRGARFSTGTRNNDGTWSLASDELEDLHFQIPENADGEQTLVIRVVSLTGGDTLAVHDFPVRPGAANNGTVADSGDAVESDARLERLRTEFTVALAARETELKAARKEIEEQRALAIHAIETEMAKARETWKAELDEQLKAAVAQTAAQTNEARAHAAQETKDALAKAEQTSKAAEAARIAALEARWREEAATALAAAEAQSNAVRSAHERALGELRTKLAAVETRLAEREAELATTERVGGEGLAHARKEAAEALAKAEQSWKADEAARFAKAEQSWKADEAARFAKADAEWRGKLDAAAAKAAGDADVARELQALRDKAAALEATLADRDQAIALARKAGEDALVKVRKEATEALAHAAQTWKAEEAKRVAAAETEWRSQLDAVAGGESKATHELLALRDKAAALEATIGARDAALAEARKAGEEALERLRQSAEALTQAQQSWKAEEAKRLAAVEASWRAKLEQAVASAAPAQPAPPPPANDGETNNLREQVAALEKALAARDATLERMAADRDPPGAVAEAVAARESAEETLALSRMRAKEEIAHLKVTLAKRDEEIAALRMPAPSQVYPQPNAAQTSNVRDLVGRHPDSKAKSKSSFVAALVAAIVVGVAAALFFPTIDTASPGQAARVIPVPRWKPELELPKRFGLIVRETRLRASPSEGAAAAAKVGNGLPVQILEERRDWLRVRAADGKREGWIERARVKENEP